MSKQEKIGLVMLVVATIGAGYLAWALFVAPGAAASEGALSGMRDNVAKLFAVLLLGTERGGLSETLRARAQGQVAIAMREGVSSLNLATAAAVILFTR